jgi:hypothetical protein
LWIQEPNQIKDPKVHALIVKAWENDSENPTAYKILSEKSREYEFQVEKMLRAMGLEFKTQEQLVEEQIKVYGRPIITPDFLLTKPVVVVVSHPDGSTTEHTIKWIDVKNYMLIGVPFITKSITEQATRYTAEFGPGAFLFHYGFLNTIKIPNVVMLSDPGTSKFSRRSD